MDQDDIFENVYTLLETQARGGEQRLSWSTPVRERLADCHKSLSVETSTHIRNVLGLVSGQRLLPVVEVELPSMACCQRSVRWKSQQVAVSPYDLVR